MSEMKDLKPKALWNNFQKLCDIPRPSKKEDKVVEFIKKFGLDLGLETKTDEVGNVLIKKPATKGMEDLKTVVFQGHLDMVPQKNSGVDFDFEKDPIQAYVDGEWVTAKDTTLGSDNGMGVAAAMAVLEANDIAHGPIEALFTVDEETGMTGAFNLKPGFVEGDILLNMDSEDEGDLYIGCAGGMDTISRFKFSEEEIPENMTGYQIKISGLKGGHSGLDIHLGRGNANKILNRILWVATRKNGLRLSSFNGGTLRNAIPREAEAHAAIPTANETAFLEAFKELTGNIKNELSAVEPNLKIEAITIDAPAKVIDLDTQNSLLNAIYACPNGVLSMIADMPDVVETSTSLGVVKTENGTIEIVSLSRSSVDSLKESTGNMIVSIFEPLGASVEHKGSYPGWKPNIDSPILKTMKEVYNKKFGKIPAVKVIHAGLECGLIGDVNPQLDMISFGPTIDAPHSPDERVHIGSVQKFWDFLLETLKDVPKK